VGRALIARILVSSPIANRRLRTLLPRRLRRLGETPAEAWERSRARWRAARPDADLTWGAEIEGGAFIAASERHGAFGADKRVLEVGPGYGRLLRAARSAGTEFDSWTGIDLSAENVAHLTRELGGEDVSFVQADVETYEANTPIDSVISSLTFKHLYPSFATALANLARQLREGGVVVFDLIEGDRRYFEDDGVTYIRWYERTEIERIAGASGLEVSAFDHVEHYPGMVRLLVVARRPV
jgi:SAM-dependent methyltransferase